MKNVSKVTLFKLRGQQIGHIFGTENRGLCASNKRHCLFHEWPAAKLYGQTTTHCLPTLDGYRDVPGSSFSTKKRVHSFFHDHINNGRWLFITLNWHECMVFPVSTHIRKLRLRHAISKLLKSMRYRDVYIFKMFKSVVISRRAVYKIIKQV